MFIKKNLVSVVSLVSLSTLLTLLVAIYLPVYLSDLMPDCLQILLARQAVRAKRRFTRRTAKQRLIEGRKILQKLRLLAKEVRNL